MDGFEFDNDIMFRFYNDIIRINTNTIFINEYINFPGEYLPLIGNMKTSVP